MHVEVVWHCLPVREAPPADVPSLGEAERELAEALRDATEVLTRLDVAASGPVAEAALDAYRARAERGGEVLAPGYPPRAVRVLELAQRVGLLVLAWRTRTGTAGAVSASEMAARAEALRPVERTARRAQVAAYNAYVEERERGYGLRPRGPERPGRGRSGASPAREAGSDAARPGADRRRRWPGGRRPAVRPGASRRWGRTSAR